MKNLSRAIKYYIMFVLFLLTGVAFSISIFNIMIWISPTYGLSILIILIVLIVIPIGLIKAFLDETNY